MPIALLLILSAGRVFGQASSAEELARRFKSALEGKDVAALMALYCPDGVTPETRQIDREIMSGAARGLLSSVTVEPASPDRREQLRSGIRYRLNLAPVSQIKAVVVSSVREPGGQTLGTFPMPFIFPVGVQGGRYYLAASGTADLALAARLAARRLVLPAGEKMLVRAFYEGYKGTMTLNGLDTCPLEAKDSQMTYMCGDMTDLILKGKNTMRVQLEHAPLPAGVKRKFRFTVFRMPPLERLPPPFEPIDAFVWRKQTQEPGTETISFVIPAAALAPIPAKRVP